MAENENKNKPGGPSKQESEKRTQSPRTMDDFIIEQINHSGYPLEMTVASIISSIDGWKDDIACNPSYFDKDINKSREIDIKTSCFGNLSLFDELTCASAKIDPPSVMISAFIECKKCPESAWVFFKTPAPKPTYPIRYLDSFRIIDATDGHASAFYIINPIGGADDTHFEKCKAWSTSHTEILLNPNGGNKRTDNIFDATYSLMKAINYEIANSKNNERDVIEDKSNKGEISYDYDKNFFFVNIFYPIIVLDGNLYEATVTNGGVSGIEPKNHIQVIASYGVDENHHTQFYTIDVVKKEFFSEYFKKVGEDLKIFSRRAYQNRQELLKRYTECLRQWHINTIRRKRTL